MKWAVIGLMGLFSIASQARYEFKSFKEFRDFNRDFNRNLNRDSEEIKECDREKIAYFRAQARIYDLLYIRSQERAAILKALHMKYKEQASIWKTVAQDHRNIAGGLAQYPRLVEEYNNEARKFEEEGEKQLDEADRHELEAKAKKILDDAKYYRDTIPKWEANARKIEEKCVEQRARNR